MENTIERIKLPLNLGVALTHNSKAMDFFINLPIIKQKEIIKTTHNLKSINEVYRYVDSILTNL